VRSNVYVVNPEAADKYDELFAEYRRLHDYFGRGPNDVLHRLRAMSIAAKLDRGASS
jgi:L-ribulokinase